jgi:hypothetical protein
MDGLSRWLKQGAPVLCASSPQNADNSSQAEPKECTTTAGYMSNAEINNIVNANVSSSAKSWCDSKTDSNYAVWDSTQWVAGMTEDVKASRKKRLEGLNFAGTVDWAVDLVEYTSNDGKTDGTCSKDPDSTDDCPDGCKYCFDSDCYTNRKRDLLTPDGPEDQEDDL